MNTGPLTRDILWLDQPEEHDYVAATSYLSLIYEQAIALRKVARLRAAPPSRFKAKDIFRAAGPQTQLLTTTNKHCQHDLEKIRANKSLSPLLLVRTPVEGKVIVADGWHRLEAVHEYDEDAWVPCKIV